MLLKPSSLSFVVSVVDEWSSQMTWYVCWMTFLERPLGGIVDGRRGYWRWKLFLVLVLVRVWAGSLCYLGV